MENSDPTSAKPTESDEREERTAVIGPQGRTIFHLPESLKPHDFRQPAFLAPTELRKLRLRHEDFVRSLASRLSMYPRLDLSLRLSRLQTMYYQKFAESLSTPTHLTLFKTEPLRGIGLLDIPPCLGLTIVDRLLGGSSPLQERNRDLTEIETALLDQAVQIILNEWCNHWQPFQDLRPSLLGHENNGRFLQTAPHDTVMVCIAMEVGIGESVQQMQMAFPHYTLEPIVQYLTGTEGNENQVVMPVLPLQPSWNKELDEVPVGLRAEWDGIRMTARELVALELGQVIFFDPRQPQEVKIHIASITKYQGRLGTCGRHWAVELTQSLAT